MQTQKFHRTTKRLTIRPLKKSDYVAWKNAYSNMLPQQNKFDTSVNRPIKELSQVKFKNVLKQNSSKRRNEDYCDYGVFLKNQNVLIGRFGLGHFIRSLTQSSFVGYALFNRYWKQGYAQEALHALIEIAFHDHKLHRVVAGIEIDNKKSIQLVKKLGFRKEGIAKKVVFLRDEWQDLVQYALTTDDLGLKWHGKTEVRKK